jgi:hypothetical protein
LTQQPSQLVWNSYVSWFCPFQPKSGHVCPDQKFGVTQAEQYHSAFNIGRLDATSAVTACSLAVAQINSGLVYVRFILQLSVNQVPAEEVAAVEAAAVARGLTAPVLSLPAISKPPVREPACYKSVSFTSPQLSMMTGKLAGTIAVTDCSLDMESAADGLV